MLGWGPLPLARRPSCSISFRSNDVSSEYPNPGEEPTCLFHVSLALSHLICLISIKARARSPACHVWVTQPPKSRCHHTSSVLLLEDTLQLARSGTRAQGGNLPTVLPCALWMIGGQAVLANHETRSHPLLSITSVSTRTLCAYILCRWYHHPCMSFWGAHHILPSLNLLRQVRRMTADSHRILYSVNRPRKTAADVTPR